MESIKESIKEFEIMLAGLPIIPDTEFIESPPETSKTSVIESQPWMVFASLYESDKFFVVEKVDLQTGVKTIQKRFLSKINKLPKQSIYFHGLTGIGKTRLANHWKLAAKIAGLKTVFVEESQIFDDPFNFVKQFIEETKLVDVFIIDEIFLESNWATVKASSGAIVTEKFKPLYRFYDFLYKKHHEGCLILMTGNKHPEIIFSAISKFGVDPEKTFTRRIKEITEYRLRESLQEDIYV